MKIDSAKNFSASSASSGSGKTNLANSESENLDGLGGEGEGGSSNFASVLENLTSQKDSSDQKTDLSKPKEHDNESSKLEQHHKTEQPTKDKVSNRTDNADAAAASASAGRLNNANNLQPETVQTVPPARAILHIADLERIISSVRAQNFNGNSQIVITLKNSVCSGLQIKLTSDENHRVTAELIAANEKVKAQIDARSSELADLLRQRGLKLTSLKTTVDSGASGDGGNRQQSEDSGAISGLTNSAKTSKTPESVSEHESEGSETSNSYRV